MTIPAKDVSPGMIVRTIPMIETGRVTRTTVTVAVVNTFEINGESFTDLDNVNGGGVTLGSHRHVEVVSH